MSTVDPRTLADELELHVADWSQGDIAAAPLLEDIATSSQLGTEVFDSGGGLDSTTATNSPGQTDSGVLDSSTVLSGSVTNTQISHSVTDTEHNVAILTQTVCSPAESETIPRHVLPWMSNDVALPCPQPDPGYRTPTSIQKIVQDIKDRAVYQTTANEDTEGPTEVQNKVQTVERWEPKSRGAIKLRKLIIAGHLTFITA